MPPFVETIRIEGGKAQNLPYHQARLNATHRHFFPSHAPIHLTHYIPEVDYVSTIYKCRVVYDSQVQEVSIDKYMPRHVATVRLVTDDEISYPHKSTDRSAINQAFAQRGSADEVLIVRHGLLTDTSIANVAFRDGNRWFTPSCPLLKGTERAKLLAENRLTEANIRPCDLQKFSHIAIFNALLPFGSIILPTECIVPE